jgi:hypothetical protein
MDFLCKYKDLNGEPGTGIHKYRFMDLSIVDVIGTILIIIFISVVFKIRILYVLVIVIIIMIISHRAFCVRSTTDKWLFP